MKEITSIACVTAHDVCHEYSVGCNGVTSIQYIKSGVGSYNLNLPGYYIVCFNDGLYVRISEICPVVLHYI